MGMSDDCIIIPLTQLLNESGVDEVSRVLSAFKPIHDSATETFLKKKAIDMELRDLCRTYIAFSKDDMKILGYISVAIKCLRIPYNNVLSGKVKKSMSIDSGTNIVQAYLIGQLSRSADAPRGLGIYLLDTAFETLRMARNLVGCRVVRLDCHDELVPYYTAQGFNFITEGDGESLNQMFAFVHTRSNGYEEGEIFLEDCHDDGKSQISTM